MKKSVELADIKKNGHELDADLTKYIIEHKCYPSGIGFMNFPKSICISPNDVLVHGIPNTRPFGEGDWINLDVTVFKDGFYGDNSTMVTIGEPLPEIQRLMDTTKKALYEAIDACKVGKPIKLIGEIIGWDK